MAAARAAGRELETGVERETLRGAKPGRRASASVVRGASGAAVTVVGVGGGGGGVVVSGATGAAADAERETTCGRATRRITTGGGAVEAGAACGWALRGSRKISVT